MCRGSPRCRCRSRGDAPGAIPRAGPARRWTGTRRSVGDAPRRQDDVPQVRAAFEHSGERRVPLGRGDQDAHVAVAQDVCDLVGLQDRVERHEGAAGGGRTEGRDDGLRTLVEVDADSLAAGPRPRPTTPDANGSIASTSVPYRTNSAPEVSATASGRRMAERRARSDSSIASVMTGGSDYWERDSRNSTSSKFRAVARCRLIMTGRADADAIIHANDISAAEVAGRRSPGPNSPDVRPNGTQSSLRQDIRRFSAPTSSGQRCASSELATRFSPSGAMALNHQQWACSGAGPSVYGRRSSRRSFRWVRSCSAPGEMSTRR